MRTNPRLEEGFTAVELMITLFIAAIFLFSGYQLYSHVSRDGSEAAKTAQMSSLVYNRLREVVSGTTGRVCSGTTTETPTISGFSNVTYTITKSCPNSDTTLILTRVEVKAQYYDGISTKTLSHATYTY